MKKLLLYYFFISFLLIFSNKAEAQSKKIVKASNHDIENKKTNSEKPIQYSVTAHFVDKGFKAVKSVNMQGKNLETIKVQLNEMRNGLDIIIAKVMIIRNNWQQELMKNVPSEFMRETDSLLKERWAAPIFKK